MELTNTEARKLLKNFESIQTIDFRSFQLIHSTSHPITPYSLFLTEHCKQFDGKCILDFGTGSGIQAVNAILEGASFVYGVDICKESEVLFSKNLAVTGLCNNYCFIEIEAIPQNSIDVIVSNPASLPVPDKTNFPRYMNAGEVGLNMYSIMFEVAQKVMKLNGKLIVTKSSLCPTREFEILAASQGIKIKLLAKKTVPFKQEYYEIVDHFSKIGSVFFEGNGKLFENIEILELSFHEL